MQVDCASENWGCRADIVTSLERSDDEPNPIKPVAVRLATELSSQDERMVASSLLVEGRSSLAKYKVEESDPLLVALLGFQRIGSPMIRT